ncbi:MAG: hypothetical protein SGJ19_07560 [Planctomycetia bacterium]|nr:hypothetical protein [Planctomycetia bacterium]
MLRCVIVLFALLTSAVSAARACDGVVAVAPTSVFVDSDVYAPLAVSVTPAAVFASLAVQVDAFAVSAAPLQVRVLSRARGDACLAPRVRLFARPARSRVSVRVR